LFAVTAIVFRDVIRCDFINYDDDLYVTGNAWVRHDFQCSGGSSSYGRNAVASSFHETVRRRLEEKRKKRGA
jgi:hypothetical protein